jgi:HEAT repeat protein
MTPKDVTRLWEELRHRDPEEKIDWIRQLAKDPTPESIEVLLDVLTQESWFLRDQAARALASLGEDVFDSLVEYLGSGLWYTRAAAASALGRMALPIAAEPLTNLLRDPNRTVRDAGWDALVKLSQNDLAAHAVADAFSALPERAQRFALEGLFSRDADIADRIGRIMSDPALRAAGERAGLKRAAGDDDGFVWNDVVGDGAEDVG